MALLDGPGSIPRIHVVANNCHCGPNAFFWSFQDYMHTVHKHTSGKTPIHTKQKQILKIIKMTELYHSKQISKKKDDQISINPKILKVTGDSSSIK